MQLQARAGNESIMYSALGTLLDVAVVDNSFIRVIIFSVDLPVSCLSLRG